LKVRRSARSRRHRSFRAGEGFPVTVLGVDPDSKQGRLRRFLPVLVASLLVCPVAVVAVRSLVVPSLPSRLAACRTNDCVVSVMFAALESEGPEGVLAAYSSTNPDSGGGVDCHDAAHRLGEYAWEEYGFAAWVAGGNVCNFGYYHGFMVGASADASLEEFTGLAHRLCAESPLPEEDLPGPECVHGFGHAVFHLSGTLSVAVDRCAAFSEAAFRRRCNEGAVKDSLMVKPTVTEEDFGVCAQLSDVDEGTCVYVTAAYSVVRASDLASASSVCSARPQGDLLRECREGLGRGVSMRAVGERFPSPGEWAVEVCDDSAECAFGFGRSVYFIRNDVPWSLSQCAAFGTASVARCREGVADAPGSR
jgi:hypothetical protein